MSRQSAGGPLRALREPPASSDHTAAPASRAAADADTVYGPHIAWLRMMLQRRLGADLADDIGQEAYVRAVQSGAPSVRNPRGLLMTVALNLARDGFRREKVRQAHIERFHHATPPSPFAGQDADDDLHVRQVILSLPPKLREVLLLSKIGGLTNREIAQRYGLSVRAVDKRLQKAITLFVTRLRD